MQKTIDYPDIIFRSAQKEDAEKIESIYQSVKGERFCVWNEFYPSISEVLHDLETQNLYVMTHEERIIGAISIVPENELGSFECWSNKNGREIARVVVDIAFRGRGLSFSMVRYIEEVLRQRGCESIHLSVAKSNIPAYKTYLKAGFVTAGDADMYGNSYYLMEKDIDNNCLNQ